MPYPIACERAGVSRGYKAAGRRETRSLYEIAQILAQLRRSREPVDVEALRALLRAGVTSSARKPRSRRALVPLLVRELGLRISRGATCSATTHGSTSLSPADGKTGPDGVTALVFQPKDEASLAVGLTKSERGVVNGIALYQTALGNWSVGLPARAGGRGAAGIARGVRAVATVWGEARAVEAAGAPRPERSPGIRPRPAQSS